MTNPTRIDDFPRTTAIGDGKLYLKAVSIGMGDCTLVILPNGKIAIIDCGSSRNSPTTPAAIQAELPGMYGYIPDIALLVLTHPDGDHYNWVGKVVGDNRVDLILHSMARERYSALAFRQWYWRKSNVGDMRPITVNATSPAEVMVLDGGNLGSGGHVQLFVVAANVPDPDGTGSWATNTASVVVVGRNITSGQNLFLVAGDATCETEDFMLNAARVGRVSNVGVMRVAHHGSSTSSRTAFVQTTNPSVAAVISSSQNNGAYCLPKQSVVMRWNNQMAATAQQTTIGYWADGAGTECAGQPGPDEPAAMNPNPAVLPYAYQTATTYKALSETFLDGTMTWQWA